jgi:hypothetical protein
LGRGGRILAAALAAIWLLLVSPLALGYGWIWARVAVTGRRQEWPPWGRREQRR